MTNEQLVLEFRKLGNTDRLAILEIVMRMIREDLTRETMREDEIRASAASVQSFYEPGTEHTEWTSLDGEDFTHDYASR